MMRNVLVVSLAVLSLACAGAPQKRGGADAYKNFAGLRAENTEGRDYSREVYDRGSEITVFALHGGDIEPGTARVARELAAGDLNLYVFCGWQRARSPGLHLTATHFDDPAAVELSTRALLGFSVHGQSGRGYQVCVGGANRRAAEITAKTLEAAGFPARTPCPRLPGVSPANIVNLPARGGVQLEITAALLERLELSPLELANFAGAVRKAAFDYLETSRGETK